MLLVVAQFFKTKIHILKIVGWLVGNVLITFRHGYN